eukprot:scaffold1581_cov169-Amphora_coffeaeformis.AAC.3
MGKRSRNRSRHQNGRKNHLTQHGNNHNAFPVPRQPFPAKHKPPQEEFHERRHKHTGFQRKDPNKIPSRGDGNQAFQSSMQASSHFAEDSAFSSRKRALTAVEFVYPKKNGFKEAYRFSKSIKNNSAQETDEGQRKNGSKSIEEILYPSRKRSSSKDTSSSTENSLGTSGDDDTSSRSGEGQLSGRSVEDAVRDKVGCRPRANSTDGELNLPQRGLCDERTVLEAYRWRRDLCDIGTRRPTGFNNLGNTCYLNATLQCLAHIPAFCQSLLTLPSMHNGKKDDLSPGKRFTLMLKRLFARAHRGHTSTTAPRRIVNNVPSLSKTGSPGGYKFRPGRQEDCHEFLVHLLDAMNDGELREAGIDQDASGWRDRLPIPRLDETTFIRRTFGGYFRSQVQCTRCGYKSNTYDPFLDLSLQISKKSCNSVLDSLRDFTRKEKLDIENQWKCSGCNKHLKRFTYSETFQLRKKISKPFEFPALLKLPLSDGRSCQYSLTGVVMHLGGSAHLGHYTACVKKPGKNGKPAWFLMDDSYAEPISEKAVLRQSNAYMLFYCRDEVKIEYPSPPLRSSMSAEEAQELGRVRSLAKAQKSPDSINRSLENDKTKQKVGKENMAADREGKEAATKAEVRVAAKAENPSDSSESSSSGSSDSESDSSSDSSNEDVNNEEVQPPIGPQEKPKVKASEPSGESKTTPSEAMKRNESRDEKSSDTEGSSSDSSSSSTSADEGESKEEQAPKPPKAEKEQEPEDLDRGNKKIRTQISLDRGDGNGKVSLMLGPRFKGRGWIPGTNNTPKGQDFELLGNVAVGKWDEEGEGEGEKPAPSTVNQRAAILEDITKGEKLRKRRMYLDGWDAALDRGKKKKVKGEAKRARPIESQNHRFQKIQASVQRMNRGRAKGFFRQDGDKRNGRR